MYSAALAAELAGTSGFAVSAVGLGVTVEVRMALGRLLVLSFQSNAHLLFGIDRLAGLFLGIVHSLSMAEVGVRCAVVPSV